MLMQIWAKVLSFVTNPQGALLPFVATLVAVNTILSALSAATDKIATALDEVAQKSQNQTESKVAGYVHKIASILGKGVAALSTAIDWITANRQH